MNTEEDKFKNMLANFGLSVTYTILLFLHLVAVVWILIQSFLYPDGWATNFLLGWMATYSYMTIVEWFRNRIGI